MTYEQAINLKSFKNYCQCGGYACDLNGRDPEQPHMNWCPQLSEWLEWKSAIAAGRLIASSLVG